MLYSRTYGGVIWTTHALDRIRNRKIPQEIAWKTFRFPDRTQKGKEQGTLEMVKRFGNKTCTLIACQNEDKKWIIISSWIDPPYRGSIDIEGKDQSESLLFRIFSSLWNKIF